MTGGVDLTALRGFARAHGDERFIQALDTSFAPALSEEVRDGIARALCKLLGARAAARLPADHRAELVSDTIERLDAYRATASLRAEVERLDVEALGAVGIMELRLVRPAEPGERGDEDGEVPAGIWLSVDADVAGIVSRVYVGP